MKITVDGFEAFASTGGRAFDPEGEVVVFLHGSGQSHLGYQLQHRYLANRGWQVLTPDFPGHGLSKGAPLASIEAQADWLDHFLTAASVRRAHIVGHSQGGLVALEFARRYGPRVQSLIFMATALSIPVNDALISMADKNQSGAIAAMMDWGHGPMGHRHDHTMPGTSHMLYGARLMDQNAPGALFAGLSACAAYDGGSEAARLVDVPSLCILAGQDKMTPIKAGRKLAASLPRNETVEIGHAGHMVTTEAPYEVNRALRAFLEDQRATA